jgi:hypothetical protein
MYRDPILEEFIREHATPEPEPVSVAAMNNAEYAAYREQIGMGQSQKEGKGIFDSVSSRSQAYTDAARVQSGRTAWVGSNVEDAPKIDMKSRLEDRTSRLDERSAAQRFSTPGNSFQG